MAADPERCGEAPKVAEGKEEEWSKGVDADTVRRELAQVEEVLKAIFEYYGSTSTLQAPRMTSAKFCRFALDAVIVSEDLTHAKVDVTFHRVCGSSPHMNLEQFRDAIVRLAVLKFPEVPRQEAVLRLYHDHLSTFSGHAMSTLFTSISDGTMAVLASSRAALRILYEAYFAAELRRKTAVTSSDGKRAGRPAAGPSEAQAAFVQVLSDFEVLPELSPKSNAYSIFREVAKITDVPIDIRERIAPGEPPPPARIFCYEHFALALATMARRCFPDEDATALVRLLHWMDSSKGRILFAAQFPGQLAGGATSLRLAPERLPEEQLNALPVELQGRVSSTLGQPRLSIVSKSGSKNLGAPDSRRPSLSPADLSSSSLPDWVRRLAQQTFCYYTSLGDPLNRTHLSSLKFGRFLRDCGLLPSEAVGPASFGFSPDSRLLSKALSSGSSTPAAARPPSAGRQRSSSSGRLSFVPEAVVRSGSTGALRRISVAQGSDAGSSGFYQRRESVSFSISPGKQAASSDGAASEERPLPLKVFPEPLLTQVDADLFYVQSVRQADLSGGGSTPSGARKSVLQGGGNSRRHHMNFDGFCKALGMVARSCVQPECVNASQALEDFAKMVLTPLSAILFEARGEDVDEAKELLRSPECARLFQKCQAGLEKVYLSYAVDAATKRPYWSGESIIRFAHDFDISSEVSHLPLQRIFQDCCDEDRHAGSAEGRLSYGGFELVLVMLSKKVHLNQDCAPLDCALALFHRINSAAHATSVGLRFGPQQEILLSIPKETLLRRATVIATTGARGSIVPARTDKGRKEGAQLSWMDLLSN